MLKSPWEHLPNAALIEYVLADSRDLEISLGWRGVFEPGREMTATVEWHTAWDMASRKVADAVPATVEVWHAAIGDASIPAISAVIAILAWPSSADMVFMSPDALRTIIATCSGDVKHQAALILPALVARNCAI